MKGIDQGPQDSVLGYYRKPISIYEAIAIDVKYRLSLPWPGARQNALHFNLMIECPNCHTPSRETSRFCEECGTRLAQQQEQPRPWPTPPQATDPQPPVYVPPALSREVSLPRMGNETRIDIPAMPLPAEEPGANSNSKEDSRAGSHAVLIIERGDAPGTEFRLVGDDVIIGRWDADNGVFPDVDLDAYDSDAKVSRRHARIRRHNSAYSIEDLGSTNGTYVNRGRRLLPGNAQALHDGDEVIVGKTFLRFQIVH